MKDLITRLRETASKGVSAWGDLQMEAASKIEHQAIEAGYLNAAADRLLAEVERLTKENAQLAAARDELRQCRTERLVAEDVGKAMIAMTTCVHGIDEWPAIPELWRLCMVERDALSEIVLKALESCRTGGYVDCDRDFQKTWWFDEELVAKALLAAAPKGVTL